MNGFRENFTMKYVKGMKVRVPKIGHQPLIPASLFLHYLHVLHGELNGAPREE